MAAVSYPSLGPLIDTFLPGAPADANGPAYPSATQVGMEREVWSAIGRLSAGQQREFATLLRTIENPFLNLLLSGRPVRFSRLSPEDRRSFLLSWSRSRLAVKRKAFHAVKRLSAGIYFGGPLAGAPHPLWTRIHYAPPPSPTNVPDPLADLGPVRPSGPIEETADVAVVGSGAGGSVIAERTASAGYRTVILESGPWLAAPRFPRIEREAHERLFYGGGVATTQDGAFGILAGETVGGSTSINWMTCLPPRKEARIEWAREGGMVGVDGPAFDQTLHRVMERMRVSRAESTINASNDALRRGAVALGYREGVDWDVIPRNAVGCATRCGFCTFGCPYSARQSALTAFLADALRQGARLYASTRVESVEVEGGRARGLRATYREGSARYPVHVRARAVVLAGSALETPALLLNSGVRSSGVGAGFRLDPTTALAAEFPGPIRTWEGPHQTVGVYKFQATDADAHGPWIEVAPAHPGLAAIALPWVGPLPFLRTMERLEHTATPIVLVRDVGEGRVRVDAQGRPVFDYRLTPRDRQNLVRGLVETARLLRAAGAVRVQSLHMPPVEAGTGARPLTEAEFDRFAAGVERAGIRENSIALFSAHPMGSARAGRDARSSAARPSGEVHGVDGLWIGDGSLLPSAPGANPMISIVALAARVADHLLAALAAAG